MYDSKTILTLSLIFFSCVGASKADPIDPWLGEWKGECHLIPAYRGTEAFRASLEISPRATEGEFKWKLIYEASGSIPHQVRDYILKPVDIESSHYVIDEKNGLLLDTFIRENVMYSPFRINGKLITATYTLAEAESIVIDMPSLDAEPVRETCLTGNPNLCAESFGLLRTQRCTLDKE